MRAFIVSIAVAVVASLSGCALVPAGLGMTDVPSFDRGQTYSAQGVQHGTVVQVREVKVNAQAGSAIQGVIAGAPISYLASQLFRNKGVATQIGAGMAVAWGTAAVGNVLSSSRGVEALVHMDDGRMLDVVQPMEQGSPIVPGMKVLLVGNGRIIRSSY